jgi:hypothetical protein
MTRDKVIICSKITGVFFSGLNNSISSNIDVDITASNKKNINGLTSNVLSKNREAIRQRKNITNNKLKYILPNFITLELVFLYFKYTMGARNMGIAR